MKNNLLEQILALYIPDVKKEAEDLSLEDLYDLLYDLDDLEFIIDKAIEQRIHENDQ